MPRRRGPFLAMFVLASAAPLAAAAQTDRSQVDQVLARPDRRPVDQISRPSAATVAPPQLPQTGPGANPQPKQISRPGASPGAAAQLAGRDRNPRLTSIPPQMIDACEGPAAGRPPPPVVDCAAILEAVAFAARPEPSAEQALLASTPEDAQRQEASRAALGRTADADVIAARLATGDVQGSPIAQAVGASGNQGAAGAPPLPQPNAQVVITGPSGTISFSAAE